MTKPENCGTGHCSCVECVVDDWNPMSTAPMDGTEVLVPPDCGYDRAMFQDGHWFWSTPDEESIAFGPEPKGWKPMATPQEGKP